MPRITGKRINDPKSKIEDLTLIFVKKILILSIVVLIFGFSGAAQTNRVVVADFNKGGGSTNLGENFGTWDKDASDSTQGCKMSFAKDDALGTDNGRALQLDYDVDSPNPAYNGFWLKISSAKVSGFDTLSFYVKGDAGKGFTTQIKIEIKDKRGGKATFTVENITTEWQKISLTLDQRMFGENQSKPFAEFVVVFDDLTSSPKTGRILIDQIEFSKG